MSFADKLSILRIILIPIFVALLIYSKWHFFLKYVAVLVFGIAIFSDFLDGLVARIKKEKSEIGKVIDPLADKLLLITAFVSLYFLGFKIPLLVVLIVVSRDLIILLGIAILHFLKIEVPIAPSIWGKYTTFFQMLTILSVLLGFFLSHLIWSLAIIFTVISGIEYIRRGVISLSLADQRAKVSKG
jgi:cardiolipin synthase